MKSEGSSRGIDALFKNRFHGAANIRGIRYQILYTTLRAFDLLREDSDFHTIRAEGIEDIDLIALRKGDEYIQVKYSQDSWNWSKLKEPIKNFIQVYKENLNNYFILAVNFDLKGDFDRLARLSSLSSKEKKHVEKKFRRLCIDRGIHRDNFVDFLSKFKIISVPEDEIMAELKCKLMETFKLGGEAIELYVNAFVANFLKWAEERKSVTISDIKQLHVRIQEMLSRESAFQAYGEGLVDNVSWQPAKNPDDFFEGKRALPGHVAAGLDVIRPRWQEKIGAALHTAKICVIRSSSGQGKSTLMYRFAFENWSGKNTFLLKAVESQKQVEQIRIYLKNKADLDLPLLLLIDNTGWQTRLWPFVARDCAAMGIRVIITIRNEDWFRYSLYSLTGFEVIEPELSLEEAREIYGVFKNGGKIYPSIDSPEWAYEKIREPHLLMEYVYFITHGRMLEDRLRDQMNTFFRLEEDPAKLTILRKMAVGDSLGTPLRLERLLNIIEKEKDLQHLLKSLDGEYISTEKGNISGLHWVRSNHLFKILHENFVNPALTALDVIDLIPIEALSNFIANALSREDVDREIFFDGLLKKSENVSLKTVISYLDGIFDAGERHFFEINRDLFDEAFEFLGTSGVFLLGSEFLPIIKPNTIDRMLEILDDEHSVNFKKLKEISSRIKKHPRGLELCRRFLEQFFTFAAPELFKRDVANIGIFLEWAVHCEIPVPFWSEIRDSLIFWTGVFELRLDNFCRFVNGLYRQDEKAYFRWFDSWESKILGYLKLHTDCIKLKISDKKLYMEFIPMWGRDKDSPINDQAVERLKKLRTAIPFCERYKSHPVWCIPGDLEPSNHDAEKDMPRDNLHLEEDINKNVAWREIFENFYLPDSYYRFQEAWYNLRKDVLAYLELFSKGLKGLLEGKSNTMSSTIKDGKFSAKIFSELIIKSDPPKQTEKAIVALFKDGPNKWVFYIKNFFQFLFRHFNSIESGNNDGVTQRLLVSNFFDARKRLRLLHKAFKKLSEITPDYFSASVLDDEEIKQYDLFADLLDIWIVNPIKHYQKNINRFIKERKELKRNTLLRKVKEAVRPLSEKGIKVILPYDIFYDHPLSYLPLAYSVSTPNPDITEFFHVICELENVKDVANFFWLIPTYNGYRFNENGFCIGNDQLDEIKNDNIKQWETLFPREVPDEILELLPSLPIKKDPKVEIRNKIEGLIAMLVTFLRLNESVIHLNNTENPFEQKLYQSYLSRIDDTIGELKEVIIETERNFKVEFYNQSESQAYKTVHRFLKKFLTIHSQRGPNSSTSKLTFNLTEIQSAIEQLGETGDAH